MGRAHHICCINMYIYIIIIIIGGSLRRRPRAMITAADPMIVAIRATVPAPVIVGVTIQYLP